ncbi:MAG TPA: 30S ribosomal protein S3 [Bacillota bacterium]|nr:30S ribosomal protein S3 [Bacillota bacterium]
MEEKNVTKLKKDEFSIREYVKKSLGKGKISQVKIEYAPIGEKIIISTSKPGLIIGRGGEKIDELTRILKKRFKLENPHIEIDEIKKPEFNAQIMADDIALSLERFGPLKFKVTAYRTLQKIMEAGALGAEIRLSGKLPSSRARTWRFAQGYLKKTGDPAKVVDRAQAMAQTKPGVVGVKVSILSPEAILIDRININEELLGKIQKNIEMEEEPKKKLKTESKKNKIKNDNENKRSQKNE